MAANEVVSGEESTSCRELRSIYSTVNQFDSDRNQAFRSETQLTFETTEIRMLFIQFESHLATALKNTPIEELVFFFEKIAALKFEQSYVNPAPNTKLFDEATVREIRDTSASTRDVLKKIGGYYTWFNYSLLKRIALTFCHKNREIISELTSYEEQFKRYCEFRLHDQPVSLQGELGTSRCNSKEMIFKIDKKWEDIDVGQIRKIEIVVCSALKLEDHTIVLRTATNGCIKLTYDIPEHIAEAIFPLAMSQFSQLKKENVQVLLNNDNPSTDVSEEELGMHVSEEELVMHVSEEELGMQAPTDATLQSDILQSQQTGK